MLLFGRCARSDLDAIVASPQDSSMMTLYPYLPLGMEDGSRISIAVELEQASSKPESFFGSIQRARVSHAAIQNAAPYMPVRPVLAAGGAVIRFSKRGELEILMIRRRGVWDLPKGKHASGERIQACARREVAEEVGASNLSLVARLGTTSHGYRRSGAYCAKRTHWYLMTTGDTEFFPQRSEGIEEVCWMSVEPAISALGYRTLQKALAGWLARIEKRLRIRGKLELL